MYDTLRIIAGSGRSGTTWILDALAESNGLRTIFEPLHPDAIRRARQYAYKCIPPDIKAGGLKRMLDEVFAGETSSWWIDYRVRPDRLRIGWLNIRKWEHVKQYMGRWRKLYRNRQRFGPERSRPRILAKFVRANLMLEWLRINCGARIVLIVRHPGAVVESQLRLGGEWDPYARLDAYRRDEILRARHGEELEYALRTDLPVAEALAAIWVIENKPAVDRALDGGYDVVFYEHLREHPEQAWAGIALALDLEQTPAPADLAKPSQQADLRTDTTSFESRLDTRWMERIGADSLAAVRRVLQATGVEFYDADDPRPSVSQLSGTGIKYL